MRLYFILLLIPLSTFAYTTGFVTPTSLKMTVTEVHLIKMDGAKVRVDSGSINLDFARDGGDFSGVSMGAITVPSGRFMGAQVCYQSNRTAVLNGNAYQGIAPFTDGAPLWSVGSNALAANSVSATSTPNPTTLSGLTVLNGSSNCVDTYFPNPACVGGNGCEGSDRNVGDPKITLLYDLYHSVAVDANNASLDKNNGVFPIPVVGAPAAAFHLAANGTGNYSNISLVFDNEKRILYAGSYGVPTGSFCVGRPFISLSSSKLPSGAYQNKSGPSPVIKFDLPTATGRVQYAAGTCDSTSNCNSSGMMTITGFIQAQGAEADVLCKKDNQADPPFLGFEYTGANGVSNFPTKFKIQRISDPQNIFGVCSGTCGTYP